VPELRRDPIVGNWVIISTERARRPTAPLPAAELPRHEVCAFCPGHEEKTPPAIVTYPPAPGGAPGGASWGLRVVPNKFPVLQIEGELERAGEGLYDRMAGIGAHEVIIETPHHDKQLADLDDRAIATVLGAYRDRIADLKRDVHFRYVMVFKNHGVAAGATMAHTHSQLIALPIVPTAVATELDGARRYFEFRERCVFCDIVRQELSDGARLIHANEAFVVVAPWAPKVPFETWILPRVHRAAYEATPAPDLARLADALGTALRRLQVALAGAAYNFILHTSPLGQPDLPHYHWHVEIMPKVTQVAGFEWGSGFYINPTRPEDAAAFLRNLTP
jgi:UDPglucose--hexose-1-phosphate uridylyltransferase